MIVVGEARELSQELGAPLADHRCEPRTMIREEKKWSAGGEFLALEQHWGARGEQQQGRDRTKTARAGELVHSLASGRVRHLVMVLHEVHEPRGLQAEGRGASPLP